MEFSIPACAECTKKCSLIHGKDCAECTHKCLLIHGKNWDESSIVTSFFKIVMGDDFLDVMLVPPAFDRLVPNFNDQKKEHIKQFLEDSSGKRWRVTMSKCDGFWAFQHGWHAFAEYHRLEVGDFLMFHYIKGHHFVVQIFGRHGFEKHKYAKESRRGLKRARSSSNFVAEDGEKPSSGSDSMEKQSSGTSAFSGSSIEPIRSEQMAADKNSDTTGGDGGEAQVRETLCQEELVCMINRDKDYEPIRSKQMAADKNSDTTGGDGGEAQVRETLCQEELVCMINRDKDYEQEDRRITLYDLSDFETPRFKDVVGDRVSGDMGSLCVASVGPRYLEMTEDVPKLIEKECFPTSTSSYKQPNSDNSSYSQEKTNKKLSDKHRPSKSTKEDTPMMNSNRSAQQKLASVPKPRAFKEPIKTPNNGFDGRIKMVKQEQVETNGEAAFRHPNITKGMPPRIKEGWPSFTAVKNHFYALKPVKAEPVETDDDEEEELNVSRAVSWSVKVVVSSQSYLISPIRFPSAAVRGRPAVKKLVILRDAQSRLWPVLYCERFRLKVLLKSGWSDFCKANNVREGDECSFTMENRCECIFRVTITPK